MRLKPASPLPTSETFDELVEGVARVLYRKGEVFYNPAQVVNRDLSVLILRWLSRTQDKPLRVLEALSATGLRSIRYFKEVPNVAQVIANDADPCAVETIRRNVAHNDLSEDQVQPNQGDAVVVMTLARSPKDRFDVVDLDPYGSAVPFLESAICAVSDGGVLAVTCTDLAVLCGNHPEICFARYGASPLKGPLAHECAIRTVLGAIQLAANKHSRSVVPLVCVFIDFYVRLFVVVKDDKALAQKTASNMAACAYCNDCGTPRMQKLGRVREVAVKSQKKRKQANPEMAEGSSAIRTTTKYTAALVSEHVGQKCDICEGNMSLAGPFWAGKLAEDKVIDSLIEDLNSGQGKFRASERVEALLTLSKEELETPLFMHLPSMCKVLRTSVPPAASIRHAISRKGFRVSQSHTDPQAIKSDAPPELVWDILKLWVEKNGSSIGQKNKVKEGDKDYSSRASAGEQILKKKAELVTVNDVDFTVKKDRFVRKGQIIRPPSRYPQNPEPNWGPKARATGKRKRASDNDRTA